MSGGMIHPSKTLSRLRGDKYSLEDQISDDSGNSEHQASYEPRCGIETPARTKIAAMDNHVYGPGRTWRIIAVQVSDKETSGTGSNETTNQRFRPRAVSSSNYSQEDQRTS